MIIDYAATLNPWFKFVFQRHKSTALLILVADCSKCTDAVHELICTYYAKHGLRSHRSYMSEHVIYVLYYGRVTASHAVVPGLILERVYVINFVPSNKNYDVSAAVVQWHSKYFASSGLTFDPGQGRDFLIKYFSLGLGGMIEQKLKR